MSSPSSISREISEKAPVLDVTLILKGLGVLQGKWSAHILMAMSADSVRLSSLRQRVPGATKKMLIDTLHRLEQTGVIERFDLSTSMRHVEYAIRPEVRSQVLSALAALASLGDANTLESSEAREAGTSELQGAADRIAAVVSDADEIVAEFKQSRRKGNAASR